MAREHTEVFLQALSGVGFAEPNPAPSVTVYVFEVLGAVGR